MTHAGRSPPCLPEGDDGGDRRDVERAGRVRASSRPARVWWCRCGQDYSETVKPCSVPYLMLASCQAFRPSSSGVSET